MADKDDTQGRSDEVSDDELTQDQEDLRAYVSANYPWVDQLGLTDLVVELVKDDATWDEIYSSIIQTPEYKQMFPGIRREDGSMRFRSEAEYLQTVDDYRGILKDQGRYDPSRDAPGNYVYWIENDVDPNELEERFDMYNALERGSAELRAAFYVYGGLKLSTDDLYQAVVDPTYRNDLIKEYDQGSMATPMTYELFVDRSTEFAMGEVANQLFDLVESGVITDVEAREILSADPAQARQMADAIYSLGAAGGRYMTVEELTTAFSYAVLGAAATRQGLALPTKDRVQQYIEAGVQQAQANKAYSTFALQRYGLAGMAKRANVSKINQEMYERAVLLGEAGALAQYQKATKQEEALGRTKGSFSTDLDDAGRLTQQFR